MTGIDQFLVNAALRSTVILAIAAGIALGLSRCRTSAAARHAIWLLALCGSLAVPFLTTLAPAVALPLPSVSSISATAQSSAAADTSIPQDLLAWASPSDESLANLAVIAEDELSSTHPSAPSVQNVAPAARIDWLLTIWALGAGLGLLPWLLAIVSLRRVSHHAAIISRGPLSDALRQAIAKLGINRQVRLLVSADREMPMTWGVWRPTILLPAAAADWPKERLTIVLLHELAHIARRDCLAQLIGQLARAVYWFNPLAWYAQRCLQIEQERACDDIVINCGTAAPDYAQQLVSVAAACMPPHRCGFALAMAAPSRLHQRVVAILNSNQNRGSLSGRTLRLAGTLALVLSFLVSGLQFETKAARAQEAKSQKVIETTGGAIQATDRATSVAELRSKIIEQYVKPVNETEVIQGAIKGMVQSLGDPYSDYLSPESLQQMEKQIAGKMTGIGAQLEMHEKQIRVVTPLPGSPALKAGVQPGDVIVEIDGQPTAGIDMADAIKRIVGPAGSNVRLAVSRQGGQKLEIAVTRGSITLPTIRPFQSAASGDPDFMLDSAQKIGYVQLDQLGAETPRELRSAIASLKSAGLKGLILDLRTCPGGLLDSAVDAAKLFLSSGTIVTIQRRGGETTQIKAEGGQASADFPLVVLTSGQTASAAEVLVGALKDNGRALVLGTRTLGKGSIQTLIKLDERSGALKLTTAEYLVPSGRNIDKRPGEKTWGIDPDEGYFVTVDRSQLSSMDERRKARHVIGGQGGAASRPAVTPTFLEQQEHDPQLAAALKSLTARLQTGSFTKVSTITPAQIDQFLKRDEIEQRRELAAKNLQNIERELADLNKTNN